MKRENRLHQRTATPLPLHDALQTKAACRTHNITTDLNGRHSNVPQDTDMAEFVHVKVLHLQQILYTYRVIFGGLFYNMKLHPTA